LPELEKVVRLLLGLEEGSPTKAGFAAKPKPLEHLLRAEARNGVTSERDPQALRNDYIYFSPKSRYVLVEDSTGEHRPVLHEQYNSPDEYPTLHGGVEGKSAFIRGERPARPAPRLPPAQRALAKAGGFNALCLRRSLSHNQLQRRFAGEKNEEGGGFLAASGNSVAVTSNAGMTTSMRSGTTAALNNNRSSHVSASLSKKAIVASKLKRALSVETGLNQKATLQNRGPRKPGYCENCRVKYEDFSNVRVLSLFGCFFLPTLS
jgi:regulatory subunit for Cdc7p protein kinase